VNVERGAIGYFLGINSVRFRGRAAAGDVIQLTVTLTSFRRGICKLRGVAHANGVDLVRADLTTIMKAAS
jgi:3-hydroxymyristoyl/3-hydroxydecanoyl-(acyl carrier protein) dehydratase